MPEMAAKTRVELCLRKKVELIAAAEANPTITHKQLAQQFGCGKTQVGTILKRKREIREK